MAHMPLGLINVVPQTGLRDLQKRSRHDRHAGALIIDASWRSEFRKILQLPKCTRSMQDVLLLGCPPAKAMLCQK